MSETRDLFIPNFMKENTVSRTTAISSVLPLCRLIKSRLSYKRWLKQNLYNLYTRYLVVTIEII